MEEHWRQGRREGRTKERDGSGEQDKAREWGRGRGAVPRPYWAPRQVRATQTAGAGSDSFGDPVSPTLELACRRLMLRLNESEQPDSSKFLLKE